MLCDAAQEAAGKLYVMGGGWTHAIASPENPLNLALAIVVRVDWDQTNERHRLEAILLTDDGGPVDVGERRVEQSTEFEMGRPPGLKRGTALNAVMAFSFNGLVLDPGGYVWEILVNRQQMARAAFWIVPAPTMPL